MTVLSPMRAAAFAVFADASAAAYAAENAASGRWSEAEAPARARAEFDMLLPQGLLTPDHHLFEILAEEDGSTVGFLWFAVDTRQGPPSAFVYDLKMLPEFRRRGHARRAFQALEGLVLSLGVSSIGLHVFSHNIGAQALYRQLGYGVVSLNMVKQIGGSSAGSPGMGGMQAP